jgi:hypothetical protein
MSCHGTQYGAILEQWKKQMKNMLSVILPSVERCRGELKRRAAGLSAVQKGRGLIDEAEENVSLVRYGKGVHNIKYSVSLLSAANEKLAEAMKAIGSSYRPRNLPISDAVVKSECYSCHMGIEKRKTTFLGKPFGHGAHLLKEQLPCQRCHSNEPKHGETTLSINDCRTCHHPDRSINCTTCHEWGPTQATAYETVDFLHSHHSVEQGMDCLLCHELKEGTFAISRKMDCFSCHHPMETSSCQDCHQVQSQMFSGEGMLDYEATPDVMFSSLGCTDCHAELERGETNEIVRTACESCHDDSYAEIMDQWQSDVEARVDSLRRKIESLRKTQKRSKGSKETLEFLKSALEFSEIRLILVEKDGSRGAHNYMLISQMLEEAALKLRNLDQLAP